MKHATLDLYYNLNNYGVGLGYSGIFTDEITENFMLFCDDVIINQKNDLKTSKVINFLLCESFQNVVRQANNENLDNDKSFEGYFGLHNLGNDYRLNSINKVNTSDKHKVIKGIESVNDKTPEELSAMYRLKLDKGELSEKGGAGLGIIQMARKSGQNILCKVDESNSGVERLHQQIMISQLDTPLHTSRIEMCENQFMHMTDNCQILQYKGDFSIDRLDSIQGYYPQISLLWEMKK
jgi:hypothetical protein